MSESERGGDEGGRDWSDATTSQRVPTDLEAGKGKEMNSLEYAEGTSPDDTLTLAT